MALSIDSWTSKVRFLIKKHDFRAPFLYLFFNYFQKWRKCEISEEYNAKRGSEPSKTSHFRVDFSSFFHLFSEPPSWGHFWRAQAPVYIQKYDLGAICDFSRGQKSTLGTTFSTNKAPKSHEAVVPEASWNRPGCELAPKTLHERILLDLGAFLVDLGWIFDEFWRIFNDFPHILDVIVVRIKALILQYVFRKPSKHKPKKQENTSNPQTATPQPRSPLF